MIDFLNEGQKKLRGLFLNPAKANCSIYESGKMVYECLLLSEKYDLDYLEISAEQRQVAGDYDFYAFNYHHETMSWLDTKSISRLPGLKLTFVLETLPNDPFVLCPRDVFDVYCALDPTMSSADKRVYAFPRPLEDAPVFLPYQETEVPIIGTFGFATPGKGFEIVVDAVNREFDRAVIKINIPPGTHADPVFYKLHNRDYAEYLADLCQKTAKDGIQVVVSRDYMTKEELIQWCGQNTLNCFLYNRNQSGLSATTDQAISSGRPLSVSTNQTFRHIHPYLKPYPFRSLRESIELSQPEVSQMQSDWSPRQFANKFERVLDNAGMFSKDATKKISSHIIELSNVQKSSKRHLVLAAKVWSLCQKATIADFVPPLIPKAAKKLREKARRNSNVVSSTSQNIRPFNHGLLKSYSQHQEDLLIDLILQSRKTGFYVDVGANDPVYNSNTKRFYDRGWSGINIEPGAAAFKKLCESRPRDINLNLGVAQGKEVLQFFHLPNDTTLSSFNKEATARMAKQHGLSASLLSTKVEAEPLRDILTQYLNGRHIDFMSVDAEGFDSQVLKSNNWNLFRPSVVLVEINNEHDEIIQYMSECGYLLIFNNPWNGLFIDQRTPDTDLKAFFSPCNQMGN